MNAEIPLEVRVRLPLDQFELDVAFQTTHRVTGVFGVSGSGKTSLLEAIAGLRRGAHGLIRLGEVVWLDSAQRLCLRPEARGVGYVPQDSLLFPHKKVLGNLRAGRKRALRRSHDFEQTLATVIRVLDIEPLLGRETRTLSGGERQRVALGRALCSGPRLLLLDEPLASLDVGLRRKVLPFLHRVRTQFAIPMLVVSHNPIEVQALCDDLIVLREGKVIARGEPRTVLTRPDVFPIAENEGFENILPGRLLETTADMSLVGLGDKGSNPALVVPRSSLASGSRLLISVPANEITLAMERPVGLSARNIVPARVEDIQKMGTWRLISARVSENAPPIVVEVTAAAIEELHITPGTALFLIIKASSFTLYEDTPPDDNSVE